MAGADIAVLVSREGISDRRKRLKGKNGRITSSIRPIIIPDTRKVSGKDNATRVKVSNRKSEGSNQLHESTPIRGKDTNLTRSALPGGVVGPARSKGFLDGTLTTNVRHKGI